MQPQSIGRYRVLSTLGRGAMGVVYSARDDQMGRDVAVKMMTATMENDPGARARFFREAQLTGKLLHRNIVTLLDLGEENGHPFIVMELLRGSTLTKALREPGLESLEAKVDLMIQICEGLARAHAAGVVHRDVKPSNLFVLPDGSLKILDFGVARLADSNMTTIGSVIGTPDYMSPEQARGDEVDPRSDVFSAAAVFYLMTTGRKPFDAPDLTSIMGKVINEDPPPIPPDEAPAPLAHIILRALRKTPDHRYQSCVDMAADLARARRYLGAETLQMRAAVQAQFDQLLLLADGLGRVRERLGPVPAGSAGEHAARVREQFPFLCDQPPDAGPLPVLFRRDRLAAIAGDLRAVREALVGELEKIAIGEALAQMRHNEDDAGEQAPLDPGLPRHDAGDAGDAAPAATIIKPEPSRGGLSALAKRAAGTFGRWRPR